MTFFDRGTFAETAVVALSNIYNPIYDRTPISFPPNDVSNGFPFAFFSERRSVGLVNSISHPTIPLELILGGRYQHVRNDNRGIGAPAGFEIEQGHFAPSGGVVWKATPQVSVYANYAEGLEPGQVVQPPASNAGDIINPFVSHQIEGGVKLRLDAFTADIAAFRFIRPAAFLDPVTNRFEQLGERRFQGIDANFTARVTDRVRLDGGILILDAELTSTGDINGDGQVGDLNGNTAPGVSPTRIVLGGEFDVVRSERSTLTLTSRVTHNGSIFFNLDNTIKLPAVTVLDIGARFEHRPSSGGRWFATVNVTNLTNERYWQTFDEFLLLNTGAPTVFRLAIGRSF
jgi:iron complex outermembrane receptor protein